MVCFLFLFTFFAKQGLGSFAENDVYKINLHTRPKSEPCVRINLLKAFKFARFMKCGCKPCFENVYSTILVSSTLNCFGKPVVCVFHSLALTDRYN